MNKIFCTLFLVLIATGASAKESPRVDVAKPLYCTDDDPPICFDNKDELTELQAIFRSLKFEHVINSGSFVASGKTILLWGVEAPGNEHPANWAGKLLLQGLLEKNEELACKLIDINDQGDEIMHCFVDGLDIGSMIIQMGMAQASNSYYQYEQEIAKKEGRGVWKEALP